MACHAPGDSLGFVRLKAKKPHEKRARLTEARVPSSEPTAQPHPDLNPYVDKLPVLVRRVPPDYPDRVRDAGRVGRVMIQAFVDTLGRVADARVAQSVPQLDSLALSAVRRWVFHPAMADGKPVGVWVAIPVAFPPDTAR